MDTARTKHTQYHYINKYIYYKKKTTTTKITKIEIKINNLLKIKKITQTNDADDVNEKIRQRRRHWYPCLYIDRHQ